MEDDRGNTVYDDEMGIQDGEQHDPDAPEKNVLHEEKLLEQYMSEQGANQNEVVMEKQPLNDVTEPEHESANHETIESKPSDNTTNSVDPSTSDAVNQSADFN